jgi:TetR/AcrR family transcriptional regulator, regulator of mycofactocin system
VVTLDPAAPTRRERKKLETRQALEHAALRLFAERGYEQTTVEEIAEAADVAVRTFFRYFSSKQDVLFGDVVKDRVSRLRTELASRPRTELASRPRRESVITSITTVMDLLDVAGEDEEEQILARFDLLRHQPSLRTRYLDLINAMRLVVVEFVADRTGMDPRHDMYPHLLAGAAAASWDTSLTLWAESHGKLSLRDLRNEAFAALSAGLPKPG